MSIRTQLEDYMTTTASYTEQTLDEIPGRVHLMKGGQGSPLLVLHDDVGTPGWTPFYDELAGRSTVYVPSHPGYGKSEDADRTRRPGWMRNVRELAAVHAWLLKSLGLESVAVVGIGLGGWVAAEIAVMCHHQFSKMVLVGPMGVQPSEGEIVDQFLLSGQEYVELGFQDNASFEAAYGADPDMEQQEQWEINREMTTRIAWKPYMFDQGLPFLLGGVDTPTLVVWSDGDKIVPRNCADRYVEILPNARLEVLKGAGHAADLEKPKELAALVNDFISK